MIDRGGRGFQVTVPCAFDFVAAAYLEKLEEQDSKSKRAAERAFLASKP